nr:N-acetyltransferase [uncultured Pedobacter sp.]
MDNKIITKFTIANEQGIDTLINLTKEIAREKFSATLTHSTLEEYIALNFNAETLIDEMNSMSNQWLVAYINDEAAGYTRLTTNGKRPVSIDNKKAIRIADFGVLLKYATSGCVESMFEKCISISKSYQAIWLNEYENNPLLNYFENNGFKMQDEKTEMDELPIPSVYLIKEQQNA